MGKTQLVFILIVRIIIMKILIIIQDNFRKQQRL